jgi:hypothetical protein
MKVMLEALRSRLSHGLDAIEPGKVRPHIIRTPTPQRDANREREDDTSQNQNYAIEFSQVGERPERRHAGPNGMNREAEPERPSRVARSDLLACVINTSERQHILPGP